MTEDDGEKAPVRTASVSLSSCMSIGDLGVAHGDKGPRGTAAVVCTCFGGILWLPPVLHLSAISDRHPSTLRQPCVAPPEASAAAIPRSGVVRGTKLVGESHARTLRRRSPTV